MLRYFPNLVFCFHFRWTNASCHANDTLFLGFYWQSRTQFILCDFFTNGRGNFEI